jgi:hypothetical protein
MVHKVHQHYRGTSCLCACHYDSHAACDDTVCSKTARNDAARSFVAPTITYDGRADAHTYCRMGIPQPVVAVAAEPMTGFVTPFGMTSRFGT